MILAYKTHIAIEHDKIRDSHIVIIYDRWQGAMDEDRIKVVRLKKYSNLI